ncbi:hypothetical protein [Nafulsella turpanensis]|uniref:hypothetical protein n=1 Tax=Nafulsella turpanensis TaxID=1265690 RepID=UPI0003476C87|nr:hypothetical protein [Nafulsella turpanensis]
MKKHIIYWIAPAVILILYILIYFFDWGGLSFAMAPEYNREFGVIENTQVLIIVGMLVVCLKGSKLSDKLPKYFFLLGMPASLFILLEEVDYGLHIYDWYVGKTTAMINAEYETKVRNIHNSFALTEVFKKLSFLFLAIICLLAARPKGKFQFLDRFQALVPATFRPSPLLALTVVLVPLISQFAFFIKNNFDIRSRVLNGNISEFEETLIYYCIFLYLYQVLANNRGYRKNVIVGSAEMREEIA